MGHFPGRLGNLGGFTNEGSQRENCYALSFKVRTNSFADKIYKVRTEILSIVSSDFERSVSYSKKQSEGRTKRDIKVDFDYNNSLSTYRTNREI